MTLRRSTRWCCSATSASGDHVLCSRIPTRIIPSIRRWAAVAVAWRRGVGHSAWKAQLQSRWKEGEHCVHHTQARLQAETERRLKRRRYPDVIIRYSYILKRSRESVQSVAIITLSFECKDRTQTSLGTLQLHPE